MSRPHNNRLLTAAILACAALAAPALKAKPQWLRKAQADGFHEIRSCSACHVSDMPSGGPWNDRGNWLIAEKARRRAPDIDVMWLKDYPFEKAGKPASTKP